MHIDWPRGIAVLVLTGVASVIFLRKMWRIYRLLRLGQGRIQVDRVGRRFLDLIVYVLGHVKVLAWTYSGVLHLFIFWGFLVLLTTILQQYGEAFVPGWTLPWIGNSPILAGLQDLFILLVLVGVGMALYLRAVVRPPRFRSSNPLDAYLILGLITGIMVGLAGSRSTAIALSRDLPEWARGAFLSRSLATWFMGLPPSTLSFVHELFWWLHLLIILYFLTWIPEGKHLHLITIFPNIFLRKLTPRGALRPLDLEKAESLGVGRVEQFHWKDLLDTFACMECGRCTAVCPANNTGKELDPRRLHTAIRRHLVEVGDRLLRDRGGQEVDRPSLIGDVFSEDFLWQCVTCAACVQECPAFNEHIDKIVDMRRYLVMEASRAPETILEALRSLEARGHPFKGALASRTDWAKGLGIKEVTRDGPAEWLFWVGCAAAFDERAQKVAQSMARILQAAGVDFAILGGEERCTGDPARRMGHEYLFQMLAQENIATLQRHGITKILTICPHCYNTFKNEYPQFGGHFQVVHHTQFLAGLLREGRLRPQRPLDLFLTFHDPCYLGRHNGEYEAPRQVLRALGGARVVEMGLCRDRTFCCGAGGGLFWAEERVGKRINHQRAEHALETGAEVVGTACPYCLVMFEDAVKAKEAPIRPRDIAELLADAL